MVKDSVPDNDMYEDVSRVYRRIEKELPPARLDNTVLNAARAAVAPPRPLARSPFSSAWSVPVSVAAVLVLSITLAVFMSQEHVVRVPEPSPAPTTKGTSVRDDQQSMATSEPISPAAPPAPAELTRHPVPAAQDRNATAPAQPSTAPPQGGKSVFETLKLFGKTTPAQSGEASVSAVAPLQPFADVVAVQAKAKAGGYDFTVKIEGAGNDCSMYVDWWEVLSEDGRLLYRRVLLPRDANGRSVTVSGGPVRIEADSIVWIRAHTHPAGYGPVGFKGSPRAGFRKTEMPSDFATEVAKNPPLPNGCSS